MNATLSPGIRRALPTIAGSVLFTVALIVLRIELRQTSWHDLVRDLRSIPSSQILLAVLLTALNYIVLTGYDVLAFAYLGKRLPLRDIVRPAFIAYGIANAVGGLALTGFSVRYRFYSRLGVTIEELSRLAFSYTVTFWLGLLTLGGASLAFDPLPSAHGLPAPGLLRAAGWLLLLIPLTYVAATGLRRTPLRVRRFQLPLPPPRLALAQLALSCLEWTLFAMVLYALLPQSSLSFLAFLGAFLAAAILGLASHVPGGVGVFEGMIVLLLRPFLSLPQLVPALVAFRSIYYLAPFTIALVILVFDEFRQPHSAIARAAGALNPLAEQLTPRVLSALGFCAGLVLLLSGAIPASPGRLRWLEQLFPLAVVETSHFLGSVAGAVLLVVSQGLSRRLDGAYFVAMIAIAGGIVASLLKGVNVEEALLLAGVLLVLWRARPAFYRHAAFLDTRFSPDRIAATGAALAASIWLGLFVHQHVAYSHELWWQFAFGNDASRYLRASVGASFVMLIFGAARLMSPAPHQVRLPDDADLDDAARVIATQSSTTPYLVYLRDKALLFNGNRTGFVMYGVEGRTWAALGDPIGPPELIGDLIRLFLERCDDFGGTPVFYEVTAKFLHHYADFGLAVVRLGEYAAVDLRAFSMQGPRGAKFRQAVNRVEKAGGRLRLIEPCDVPAITSDLRRVSDDWLNAKSAGEKGFSMGFFDERYLSRFPVAAIERDGRIVAFANMWLGASRDEMCVDLMRYHRDAPNGVMEALFVHLFIWGKGEGYHSFALGMAPLSGFERSPVAPLWNRLGSFLYRHGEPLYGFQGLRAYKEKFNPEWEPRYLACPGVLALPRVLADLSALIAGGYRRIFAK